MRPAGIVPLDHQMSAGTEPQTSAEQADTPASCPAIGVSIIKLLLSTTYNSAQHVAAAGFKNKKKTKTEDKEKNTAYHVSAKPVHNTYRFTCDELIGTCLTLARTEIEQKFSNDYCNFACSKYEQEYLMKIRN